MTVGCDPKIHPNTDAVEATSQWEIAAFEKIDSLNAILNRSSSVRFYWFLS